MSELLAWFGPAVAIATLAYTIVSSRSKANTGKVRELERALNNKAESMNVAALAGKLDQVEDRCTRIETDFKHLPDKDVTHRMEVAIEHLRGEVRVLNASLKPVSAIAERMQEEMLERARG